MKKYKIRPYSIAYFWKPISALLFVSMLFFILIIISGCTDKPVDNPVDKVVESEEVEYFDIDEIEPLYYDVPLSHEMQDYLRQLCNKREIPVELALAFMTVENRQFDPAAISSTNDYGLFQLNIGNHEYIKTQIGDIDFLSEAGNINAGTYWISRYYPRIKNIEKVALCYHHGEGNVGNRTSTEYSRAVLREYEAYTKVTEDYHEKTGNASMPAGLSGKK